MGMQLLARQRAETINDESPTDQVIAWTLERFADQRMVITTSFGMEGCALIDMCAEKGKHLTVVYLDTMFFFPETYTLRDRMVERYPNLKFINRGTKLTPQEQKIRYGEELWVHNPEQCCQLRKMEPMTEVMADVDVWITGLMRSQSATRANIQLIEWEWRYQVLKINPLFKWDRARIWKYIQEHDVPYNPLHEQGYPTIGCTHCTKPVPGSRPGDYSRAGRWNGTDKTECGLHGGEGI